MFKCSATIPCLEQLFLIRSDQTMCSTATDLMAMESGSRQSAEIRVISVLMFLEVSVNGNTHARIRRLEWAVRRTVQHSATKPHHEFDQIGSNTRFPCHYRDGAGIGLEAIRRDNGRKVCRC